MSIVKHNFKSIRDLVKYISDKPLNSVFKNTHKTMLASSEEGSYRVSFTKTSSLDEAMDLLLHGWNDEAKKIEGRLKADKKINATDKYSKVSFDVIGHQASVPRYLQGIPTNMVNKKTIVKKQPVITIVKNIGYNGDVSAERIYEESIKALKIIKSIEASGVRVNLDVIKYTVGNKQSTCTRIRLKNASERLNVSKMAFPLVHPSMLRRIMFAYMERCEELTDTGFRVGYGRSENSHSALKAQVKPNEYVLPGFINNIDETIKEIGLKIK